jgi:isopropylmalate/homocitrate/citramalate synthase
VVGQPAPQIVIGKGSGIDSIKARLRAMNVRATEDEAMKVVLAVKEHSMKTKALLTDDEFRQVVKATLPQAVGAA